MNLDDKTREEALKAIRQCIEIAEVAGRDAERGWAIPEPPDADEQLDAILTILDAAPRERTDAERIAWAFQNKYRERGPFLDSRLGNLQPGRQWVLVEVWDAWQWLGSADEPIALTDDARAAIDRHMDKEPDHG
jgi:hypothetical protein